MLTVDLDRLRVGPGDVVLDMGCGGGRHAYAALRRGARVVALDADAAELAGVSTMSAAMHAEGEVPVGGGALPVRGDALSLPLDDASVDRVIAAEVLEHIPDDGSAIRELVRVLRPGGRLAATVPAAFPERVNWMLSDEYHNVPGGHVRIYSKGELAEKLRAGGLVVQGSARVHALHSPYWWIRCAGGVANADRMVARRYHDVLVRQIVDDPPLLRRIDAALNPFLGKSLVLYAVKP